MPIGELVAKIETWNPRTASENIPITYIDISSVDRDRKEIREPISVLAHEAPSRARQLIKADDTLVSTVRPNLNGVAYISSDFDGATASTGYCVLRPRPSRLHGRFLFHWVQSSLFICDMTRKATGASYPAVNDRIVKASTIPVPNPGDPERSLAEQKRIAGILDQADAIRRKRRAAINELNTLIPALFYDMFGDPIHNPQDWDVRSLGNLTCFMTSGSRGWARYYSAEGAIFLRIQNVGRNFLLLDDVAHVNAPEGAEANRTRVSQGDVLISVTADLGRTAVIPPGLGEAYINQHLVIVRLDDTCEPLFVSQYLASPGGESQFDRLNRTGVKAGLNFNDIKSLQVPVPPLELQHEFVKRIESIRAMQDKCRYAADEAEDLFHSLVQRAFKGEL